MRTAAHGLPPERTVRVGPAESSFIETGTPGSAPVVLLHGFPTHSYLWRHVLFALGDTVVSPYDDLTAPLQAERLPFCGHLVPESEPDELAALLRRLLAR